MGQTLTHGVYLPDEGERNCYSGLAANWQILDNSVGTIAANTAALAGKAPLVHTHTVSQITDFPAYGNAAGTICEGNDSRLSDARTPVAHTHVTADVTDLLNSAHEWTKEQICDEGFTSKSTTMERCVTPATIQHINFTFKDKNGKGIGAIRRYFRNSGEQQIQIFGNTRIKDGQYDETGSDEFFGFSEVIRPDGTKYFSFDGYLNNSIRPRLTNTYQLGDSSYQWASVYAQSYYYNGVAWGLDKYNWWSLAQFYAQNSIHVRNVEPGVAPASNITAGFRVENANASYAFCDVLGAVNTSGTTYVYLQAANKFSNGALDPNGTAISRSFQVGLRADGSGFIYTDCGWRNNLLPHAMEQNLSLGTSTNKWKSFNGINPGALSLPDMGTTADVNYFDFTSTITPLDGTDIFYRPPVDGWMTIIIAGTALALFEDASSSNPHVQGSGVTAAPVKGYCEATIPVHKNVRVKINAIGTSIYMAQVRPCLGNV